MAVTRRGYIFGVFLISILSVLVVVVSLATGSWIVATAVFPEEDDIIVGPNLSEIQYGLFGGELILGHLTSPTPAQLYVVCLLEENACAVTCKTTDEARRDEVRALANGQRTNPICSSWSLIIDNNPLDRPTVISASFYVPLVILLAFLLIVTLTSMVLAFINTIRNPTEPAFGLPGVLWTNAASAVIGTVVLLMWGIHWAVTYLQEHLAFSFTAVGDLIPSPYLGYSYWILIIPILCSLANIGLLELRRYLLERDPPPPKITIDNHSDGTIFLY